jgi:hypothetical protein
MNLLTQAPQQGNFHDCGPHVLAFMLLKALNSGREITPAGIPNFRTSIQLQLIRGSIFPSEYGSGPITVPRSGVRKFKGYKCYNSSK